MAGGLRSRRRVLFAMAAGWVVASRRLEGVAAAGVAPDDVELAKVPAKVKEAATKAAPKIKWTKATKTTEGGEVTYELEGEDAEKNYVSVELTADGKVNEVSREIDEAKVPKLVTAALKKNYPRLKVETAYEARQDGKVIRYDFEGRRPADKKDITVSVSADGKKVELDEG